MTHWTDLRLRRIHQRLEALEAALAQQEEPVPESTYHPCTFILIDGLKKLKAWDVLAEWDKAREIVDKRFHAALAQAHENDYKAGVATLREESYLNYGTRLRSSIHGSCRVHHLYPDKLSAIIGDKPMGALADVWFRLDADGRVWEWHRDLEVKVLRDE